MLLALLVVAVLLWVERGRPRQEYRIVVTDVTEQLVAAAKQRTTIERVSEEIGGLVSIVWDFLRKRPELRPIHNVAIYWDERGPGIVEVGVQVRRAFEATQEVVPSATPAGRVVMTSHFGRYRDLGAAHRAVRAWCKENGYQRAGPFWEVYGDWNDDPAKLRTDVYYLLR
jgi:effector-binding domain-containing protein